MSIASDGTLFILSGHVADGTKEVVVVAVVVVELERSGTCGANLTGGASMLTLSGISQAGKIITYPSACHHAHFETRT